MVLCWIVETEGTRVSDVKRFRVGADGGPDEDLGAAPLLVKRYAASLRDRVVPASFASSSGAGRRRLQSPSASSPSATEP